ncbi:Zinc/iron permease [Spinellus fusiger]|nr:Zinc/iron permease [Spinellus fusiger]
MISSNILYVAILLIFLQFINALEDESVNLHESDDISADICSAIPIEDYNLPLRIGSVFIILGTSACGVFSPIMLYRVKSDDTQFFRDWILVIAKFFGTGVILATAFVHMLPESYDNFHSPCLSEGWLSYGAFAGVFCMISSFALQLLELAAVSHFKSVASSSCTTVDECGPSQLESGVTPYAVKNKSISQENAKVITQSHSHSHSAGFLEQDNSYNLIGTFILELGIVMHSVIIGVTLATTDSDEFITLMIALVFHQFFEGLALGTRINELKYKGLMKPIAMGSLYILMTPIGIGIGIGIHSSFNSNASTSILAQAILDSLSAGILLYNAYVSLMSMEISHNTAFHNQNFSRKAVCFLSMYIGAGMMSLIGKWA